MDSAFSEGTLTVNTKFKKGQVCARHWDLQALESFIPIRSISEKKKKKKIPESTGFCFQGSQKSVSLLGVQAPGARKLKTPLSRKAGRNCPGGQRAIQKTSSVLETQNRVTQSPSFLQLLKSATGKVAAEGTKEAG